MGWCRKRIFDTGSYLVHSESSFLTKILILAQTVTEVGQLYPDQTYGGSDAHIGNTEFGWEYSLDRTGHQSTAVLDCFQLSL